MNYVKKIIFTLSLLLTSCSIITSSPEEPEGDFGLICSRWTPNIILCENYIETDPVAGHIKFWYYEDDLYYGTDLILCGGDLILNTENPIEDFIGEQKTVGEIRCTETNSDEIDWSWLDENNISIEWKNLYLEIEIPKCPYNQKICTIGGFGYISI